MKKQIISVISMLIIMAFIVPAMDYDAYAASKKTKKVTTYEEVVVHGSTAYCIVSEGMPCKIYKVNLKTAKKSVLVKDASRTSGLLYKNGYLYYVNHNEAFPEGWLCRVKTNSKQKPKIIADNIYWYKAIFYYVDKDKVYYRTYKDPDDPDINKYCYRQVKTNGKNDKKFKNVKIKAKLKKSNKKGYRVVYKGCKKYYDKYSESYQYKYYKCYLQKPNGKKIYLTKVEDYFQW